MTRTNGQRPPAGLGVAGKRLWRDLCDGVTFRSDELAILESACRLEDTAAALRAGLKSKPLIVAGSRGQSVANPLVAELRVTEAEKVRMLAKLDVPETDGQAETSAERRRRAAKTASHARWHGPSKVAG